MQAISWDRTCYRRQGEPFFLVSGEFHYFRVPKEDWRERLELFKEAGGNAVATYIPWGLHEPSEGQILFGDEPERDLEGFLTLCAELELYVTARPGPYQYSELKYDGLPGWLCEDYPKLQARDVHGKVFRGSSLSYCHPLFLHKVYNWFEVVCPIIARHTIDQGGAVAFCQFDNEVMGIHEWFSGWDYNADAMGIGEEDGPYVQFLQRRYPDIAALNDAYDSDFGDFLAVRPFAGDQPRGLAERRRVKDYQDFYFAAVAEYCATLVRWMRDFGIDCDIVHNSANPYMNSYFREISARLGKGFLLGSDHYYNLNMDWDQNNPTPKYATKCYYSTEMLRLMGYPPTVYELPGGSCADWPPITTTDLACCYLANIAYGMKGSNYYIFTGGPNPHQLGAFADVYDFQAAIGPDGDIRPHYETQKQFGAFLNAHSWLAGADMVCDFALGLDWEHSRSKHYCKERGDLAFSNHEAWTFWRKGMMISAFCNAHMPRIVDLYSDALLGDAAGLPLWVATGACMAEHVQDRLVRFVQQGGHLLLAPVMPEYDLDFQPCTRLRDELGLAPTGPCEQISPRLAVGPLPNVLVNGGLWRSALPAGAEAIAHEEVSGAVCGWRLTMGEGSVTWLGLQWLHAVSAHSQMVDWLLAEMAAPPAPVHCDNPNVWACLRADDERGVLFALNLFTAPMTCNLEVPGADFASGEVELPPMSVRSWIFGETG